MSLLSYSSLVDLVKDGVINAKEENINGTSIDITLGNNILIESKQSKIVDLAAKEVLNMRSIEIPQEGYIIVPGQFILASSVETFNLPNYISAEYKLKSSLARCGLEHLLAGWCDPTWLNSKLTLELTNLTEYHPLLLRKGMKIGQMIFWESKIVPHEKSYAIKGQYNNQNKATPSKGLR